MARRSLRELGAVPNKEALVRNGPLSPELCSVSEGTQRRPGMPPHTHRFAHSAQLLTGDTQALTPLFISHEHSGP